MSDRIEYITTEEELRSALGGESMSSGLNIPRQRLDLDMDARWLRASNFCHIATSDSEGRCDVSPRGSRPGSGLVVALDEETLVLPELPGNRRGDGYHNLLQNPHAGLIFDIPGRDDTLRINGQARMVRDAPWFSQLAVGGVLPPLAIEIRIEKWFYHCVKAYQRAKRWDYRSWEPEAAPSRGELAKARRCELT